MRKASIGHTLDDKRRRLKNATFYAENTSPTSADPSPKDYAMWSKAAAELAVEITDLEAQLAKA